MIRGMRRDLEDEAFKTYAEVETYAYQVAGVVALMILPVLTRGLRNDDETTKTRRDELGVALGVALQLTNIVRDVGEDARLHRRSVQENHALRPRERVRQPQQTRLCEQV